MANVYLDDVTEIRSCRGVLAHFCVYPEDGPGQITTSLPGVLPECCVSYGWDPPEKVEGDGTEVEPFVSFEE